MPTSWAQPTLNYIELFSINTLVTVDAKTHGPGSSASAFSKHPGFSVQLNAWHHVAITFSYCFYYTLLATASRSSAIRVFGVRAPGLHCAAPQLSTSRIYFITTKLLPFNITTLYFSNSLCCLCTSNTYSPSWDSFACLVGAVYSLASSSVSACSFSAGFFLQLHLCAVSCRPVLPCCICVLKLSLWPMPCQIVLQHQGDCSPGLADAGRY